MFDTIILLTGQTEQPVFAALLKAHQPALNIYVTESLADLLATPSELLARARLLAFATPVVVPAVVLGKLGYGAYNFHPGPPEFPGWAPSHFALYRGATAFGVTAHEMWEKVDSGPIVGLERFPIPEGIAVCDLEGLAYAALARLFWGLSPILAKQSEPLTALPVQWCGRKNSRRDYAAICNIPLDIAKAEFDKRIAVFGGCHFEMGPTIMLHGVPFRLMPQAAAPG